MKHLFTLVCLFAAAMSSYALTIEDGKVYTIANRSDNNLCVKDNGNDVIAMGAKDDRSLWQFIPTGKADCYYVLNVATGRYAQKCATTAEVSVNMGTTPAEYHILACDVEGTDCFGITSTNVDVTDFTDGCIGWNWKGDNTVQTFAAKAGTNHRSFWKLTEVALVGSIDLTYIIKNNDFELTAGMIEDGTNFRGIPTSWKAWGIRNGEEYTQEPGVNNTTFLPKTSYGANGGCVSTRHGEKSYWLNTSPMPDDMKLYQEVTLPAGNYRMTCLLTPMSTGDDNLTNLRMYAGDNACYFGAESKYDKNLGSESNKTFMEYAAALDGSNEPKMQTMVLEFTLDEASTIEIGIRTSNMLKDGTRSTSNNGRFRLDYFTLNKVDTFHEHAYSQNGFCTCEGNSRFEEPAQDADGFYLVDNAGKIEWISSMVAAGNLTMKVKLTADIDFEGIENLHSPIGPNTGNKYNGIFDGQGHRIKNMIINRPEDENIGFFGYLRGNSAHTVVRNLIIDKSCSITAKNRAAGISGSCQNGGTSITIENCINEANVTVSGQDAAGFVGGNQGGAVKWIMRNCLNTGTITTSNEDGYVGAFFCYSGDTNNESVYENLVNLGTVGTHKGGNLGRLNGGKKNNLIDLSETEDKTQGVVEGLTVSAIASGELATLVGWGQLIGTDANPSPLSRATVYSGWTSLYDETTGYELNNEAKAYTGVINGERLSLSEISGDIPASTPVVMNGSYYNRIAKSDVPAISQANDLKGSATPVVTNGTQYVLANVDDKVGFYLVENGEAIAAGKAYLESQEEVKAFFFDDNATGIELTTENGQLSKEIFNLAGQRVSKMQKGVNIVNGKKVLF